MKTNPVLSNRPGRRYAASMLPLYSFIGRESKQCINLPGNISEGEQMSIIMASEKKNHKSSYKMKLLE